MRKFLRVSLTFSHTFEAYIEVEGANSKSSRVQTEVMNIVYLSCDIFTQVSPHPVIIIPTWNFQNQPIGSQDF